MKIDTKIVLKDLSGKDIVSDGKEFTLGHALSNILVSAKEGGKMKLFTLAIKLHQEKSVEVDESDLAMIKTAVRSTESYTALISGQCELLLEGITDKK